MEDKAKKFSPALFGLVLFCFFLPFMDISCGGEKVVTLTGIQLVTGTSIEQEDAFGNTKREKIEREPLVIVVLLAAIAGLGLSFIKTGKSAIFPAISGGIGFCLLLIFKTKVDQEVLKEGEGFIRVGYVIGFWLMLLLLLSATGLNTFVFYKRKKE
jgi:hypothetical protein